MFLTISVSYDMKVELYDMKVVFCLFFMLFAIFLLPLQGKKLLNIIKHKLNCMKKIMKIMSLLAAMICGALVLHSCSLLDEDDDEDTDTPSIKGPKWVLVGFEAPTFTQQDFIEGNSYTVYKVDSLNMVTAKNKCSGFFSQTVYNPGDAWNGGSFLFRFEISRIPKELQGGGEIELYYKGSLPRHYGARDNDDDYAQWAYFHCFCYVDCQIDHNKIRSKEEDFDKFNGYNLPVVMMNNNEPDLFASEGFIYGNVPMGTRAGERIELTIDAVGLGVNGKYLYSTYTYEWRE